MLKLPLGTRIFMAVAPVDMRRSFSGLCAIISETHGTQRLGSDIAQSCLRSQPGPAVPAGPGDLPD